MKPPAFAAAVLALGACAAPASAHEFLVYFQFDSVEFIDGPGTPGAARFREVVKDAACFARLPGIEKVIVYARADSAGPAAYNLDLSARRGRAVADLLASHGVARSNIQVVPEGESRLSVPTGDGVPEALNRLAVMDHLGRATGSDVPGCEWRTLPRYPVPPPNGP